MPAGGPLERGERFLRRVYRLLPNAAPAPAVLVDVRTSHFLRPALLGALAAAALALAACQAQVGGPARPTVSSRPQPASAASIPVTASTPGVQAAVGSIDAAKVNRVLGPAVGEVIVNAGRGTSLGSGFVVAHGTGVSYMVTNNHVVQGATRVQVLMPDGRHWVADVQGTDPQEDIAVIRIPDPTLPVAQFADSTKLQVGQPVVAIGNPEGQEGSVTAGIVSAVHRTVTGIGGGGRGTPPEDLPDAIQTDAAINPGNSGGPLADADGHVVGVNTAGQTNAQGIGFAIPSLVAKRIAEALIAGRKPGHPYVGISFLSVADALASGTGSVDGFGIVVECVVPGSPAARAGLRASDVVETVDGTDLNNGNTLGGVLQLHNPGDTVTLVALRGGARTTLSVTLGDRPATAQSCSP